MVTTDLKQLTGLIVMHTIELVGPIEFADLCVGMQSRGFDTVKLLPVMMTLRKAGRLVDHEGFWAASHVSVLRLDEQQGATLHLIYEALDTLCSSVNELVRLIGVEADKEANPLMMIPAPAAWQDAPLDFDPMMDLVREQRGAETDDELRARLIARGTPSEPPHMFVERARNGPEWCARCDEHKTHPLHAAPQDIEDLERKGAYEADPSLADDEVTP